MTPGSTTAHQAVRQAQHPPSAPKPLLQPTGENVVLDSFAAVVNRTAAPFQNAPPAHQGAVGQISQALSGVLGVIGAPVELLNTGFALATNTVSAMLPALPAATLTALHVGMPHPHAHPPSLIPPAPPIPLPSIGTVLLSGCVSVLINGLPAARAGDVGISVTCGTFTPPLEIYTGSSKVFIGGSRAARMGDITKHCTPSAGPMSKLAKVMVGAGMAAGALSVATNLMDAAASSAAPSDSADAAAANAAAASGQALAAGMAAAQLAADAAAMAMSMLVGKDPGLIPGIGALVTGQPNVLIGGFPMPPMSDVANGLMKLVKGLRGGKRGGRKQGRQSCSNCA
ncbi:MAG TPA: PAAR domain-containing protein [Archangium sp.]|uniref:PAAR domain-containing protein n=1 Tax=Archangium sp. TaxID=1872627 RepID=UPI002E309714|nr:PAAR domain-containing protein [Archangium sp.]HEX5748983.1 PAAR domain-containing protein [Archangium sp.]